jgi:hypothetical protein
MAAGPAADGRRIFDEWSQEVLDRMPGRPGADLFWPRWPTDPARFDETAAQALAAAYTRHLHLAREAGWSDCTPGRFLMPGELEGSPALTFAPLPQVRRKIAAGARIRPPLRRL